MPGPGVGVPGLGGCLLPGCVPSLGGCLLLGGGVPGPGGGVPGPGGWCAWSGGVCSWGSLASQHALRQTPSPRGQNHRRL